jgi:hypothetical protein
MRNPLFIVLLILCGEFLYAQSSISNFNKYWFYRDRLKKRFMVEGPNQGESLVAPRIQRINNSAGVVDQYLYHYGDQTIQMGWYLGVLATEYRLLANHSQPTANTERELYHAMKAFERLDLNAEIHKKTKQL